MKDELGQQATALREVRSKKKPAFKLCFPAIFERLSESVYGVFVPKKIHRCSQATLGAFCTPPKLALGSTFNGLSAGKNCGKSIPSFVRFTLSKDDWSGWKSFCRYRFTPNVTSLISVGLKVWIMVATAPRDGN